MDGDQLIQWMDINLYIGPANSKVRSIATWATHHSRSGTTNAMPELYRPWGGFANSTKKNKIEHGEMTEQIQMPRREFKEPKLTFKDANRRTARSFFFILSLLAATFICKAIE